MQAKELDWTELLKNISKHSQSERSKELCLQIAPLDSSSMAETAAENVMYGTDVISEKNAPDLTSLDSLPKIFDRLRIKATLDIKEFVTVRNFLTSAATLKTLLNTSKNPWSILQSNRLADFKTSLYAINKAISPEGEINEDASPHLASLFDEKKKLTREVAMVLDRVIARRQMENVLQDRYVTTREGRLVLPVKSGNQHDFKGLIHDRSFTKQTVFMEPEEALPLNNRLRDLQLLIAEEIEKILREMSLSLSRQMVALENAETCFLECDICFSKAKFNKIINGFPAQFSEDSVFKIADLRHPLLAAQGIEVVPNSIELGQSKRILLLSGPNAGGKTVLLKSIGLASQMARCGLPIAASSGGQLPFFKNVDAVVGDLQSVDQNLSSFSSHMQRLTKTLDYEGLENLIVIDEICGSTDPEEGSALARSFIDHYLNKNVFAVVTSHLGPLKENWDQSQAIQHGSLEFDVKNNRPTYQLLLGIPGQSLALAVARRLGVPDFILNKAHDFLSPLSKQKANNLKEITDLRSQIIELRDQSVQDRQAASDLKKQYMDLIKKFREQRDKWLEKAIQKAEKKIENLIEDARQDRLKNKTIHDLKSELPTIIKSQPAPNRAQSVEEFKTMFKPGTMAFCSRLGRNVLIQSEPDDKGQVAVLADSMRVMIPWYNISSQKEEQPSDVSRVLSTNRGTASGSSRPFTPTTSSDDAPPQLDLRGKRVDEALDLTEKWMDDRIREGCDRLKIIHGFGTEQLKKSLRQYLSKSPYVQKWNAGDSSTGGDGITWVFLSD